MTRNHFAAFAFALTLFSPLASAQSPTTVHDEHAKARLLGEHKLALQWISWDYFGKATVTETDGTLSLKGEQRSRNNDDRLSIDGVITSVSRDTFTFKGVIETQVSFMNQGETCTRDGEYTFSIKGSRKYWRLQEMENPCDAPSLDYVDVFFAK